MKLQVPWRIKEAARILFAPLRRQTVEGSHLYCPVCDTDDAVFLPLPSYYDEMKDRYGYVHSIYLTETLNRRQYSCKAGFVERLESAGFRVEQHGIAYFGEEVFKRHAIHPRSVLYIAHKDAKPAVTS